MSRLAGLCVLVTRPAHQAQALSALLRSAGAAVRLLPLIAIEPVADPAAAAAVLQAARRRDLWIFTSANAVQQAAALDAGPWPALAAAGAATAAALELAGHPGARVPAVDGSAGLLTDPWLAAPAGQHILVVTGENTSGLAEALRRRGAAVEVLAVYRRVPVAHAPPAVAEAVGNADVAIVPSAEALAQLLRLTPPPLQPRLLALQLALPSARVVEKAQEAGFTRAPLVPARVSDAAYVDLLERWQSDCRPQ